MCTHAVAYSRNMNKQGLLCGRKAKECTLRGDKEHETGAKGIAESDAQSTNDTSFINQGSQFNCPPRP